MLNKLYETWGVTNKHDLPEFTGYEDVLADLKLFTKEQYDKDPEKVTDEIFNIYRSINIVPITYFSQRGIENKIRELQLSIPNQVKDYTLGLGNNKGQDLIRFMFPNMMTAEPKGRGSNSLKDRFYDDKKLKRAIKICFVHREGDNPVRPSLIRTALELVTGENIQNFKAFNARSIVEELCPMFNGRIYDYSAGYGGRMLGTCTSRMHYQYHCVEPNTQTVEYLTYLSSFLRSEIKINCTVSEEYEPQDIDLAFSSPPYFNLEKYCDEPTQCMVKYNTLDEWFEGYVEPTMQNIYKGLNTDGVFATNIANYKTAKEEFEIVDRWITTAKKVGFDYQTVIKMLLTTRPGVGNFRKEGKTEKYEGIYVFTK